MTDFSCSEVKTNLDQRYEILMEAAPFGLILIDLDGNIIDVNRTALKMLGSPSKEATQEINMLSYLPLQDSGISEFIRQAICSDTAIIEVLTYVSKWGNTLRLKATACGIRDSEGVVCFVAFLMEDITELEELKNKYDKLAKTLIATIDSIPSNLWIWAKDRGGKYHVVNKSYLDYLQLKLEDVIGKTDCDIWPADFAAKFRADDAEVLASCGTLTTEEYVYHPKCGSRRLRTTKTAICSDELVGELVVGIAEDITGEFAQKESAKKAIAELKAFVSRNENV